MNNTQDRMKRVAAAVVGLLPDASFLIGAGLVSYGAHMIYQPAGFVASGLFFIVAGLLAARSAE